MIQANEVPESAKDNITDYNNVDLDKYNDLNMDDFLKEMEKFKTQ